MTIEDTCTTLLHLQMIRTDDPVNQPKPMPGQAIKFLKGRKSGIARKHLQRRETHDDDKLKGPFVAPAVYEIHWDPDEVELYLADMAAKNYVTLKPEKLKWSPFIVSRMSNTEQLPTANSATAQSVGAQAMIASDAVPAVAETPRAVADLRDLGAMHSQSPFDLFNDEVLENVCSPPRDASRPPQEMDVDPSPKTFANSVPDGSLPPESTHEPASETTVGPDPSPDETQSNENEQAQLELDEALARKLARDLQMSDRSLRRRGTNDTKPAGDTRQRAPDESPSVRKSRPAAGRRTSVRVAASVSPVKAGSSARRASQGDRDEVAKRPLRSRTIEPGAARAATSARSVSPRKRRRVESPQPIEVDVATTPFRRSTRRGVTEEPTGRGQRRAAARRNTDVLARPSSPVRTRRSPRKPPTALEAPCDYEEDVEMQDGSASGSFTGAASRHSVPSEVTLVVTPTAGTSKGSPGGLVAMFSGVGETGYGMDVDEDEKDDDYSANHVDEDAEGEPDEEEPDLGEG